MTDESTIKTKAIKIIKDYMGDVTAQLYAGFYEKTEENVVLGSISELLEEYVGSSRAKEILDKNGLGNTKL
jgi:hypothetical protein